MYMDDIKIFAKKEKELEFRVKKILGSLAKI